MNFKLIAKRKERGLKQSEVAEAVGVSVMAISYYENGTREPKPEIKKKLADFYGCEESELFDAEVSTGDYSTLEQAAMPLIEYLRKNGDPHATAVVTQRGVKITSELIGIPLDYDD